MWKFWRRKRRDEASSVHPPGSYDDKLARIGSWHVDRDMEKRTREDRQSPETVMEGERLKPWLGP